MKYLKLSLFYLIVLIVSNLFLAILSYFDITNNLLNSIFTIIVLFITLLLIGIYLGKNSYKNPITEALKMALIFILIGIIVSLVCKFSINFKTILIYTLNSIVLVLGAKIGKNKRKK